MGDEMDDVAMRRSVQWKVAKCVKVTLLVILAVILFGVLTRELWNWLMPGLFGLKLITFWQAIGLVLLSKILFGGFHKHGPGFGGRKEWKRRMEERWAGMSEEERERFKAGMRNRCDWRGRGRFVDEMRAKETAAAAAGKSEV